MSTCSPLAIRSLLNCFFLTVGCFDRTSKWQSRCSLGLWKIKKLFKKNYCCGDLMALIVYLGRHVFFSSVTHKTMLHVCKVTVIQL